MSTLARAWAERQSPGSGCQTHLLEVIAAYHSDDTGFCFPSNRHLAGRLRKSEATIERGLKGLEDRGLIERQTTRLGLSGGARRRITLKGYDPVAEQADLDARKALAKARRAAKQAIVAPAGGPQNEGKVPSECGQGTLNLGGSLSLVGSIDDLSEPTGSAPQGGAGPGQNFRKDLFDRGARTVQRLTGRSMVKSRDLVGKWLKIVDDEAATVLAAIDMAEEGEIAEPTAWIGAHLHAAARRAGFGQAAYRRRSTNGMLDLAADAFGIPGIGEPGYDDFRDRMFGSRSQGSPTSGNPRDVTPNSAGRYGQNRANYARRSTHGALSLLADRLHSRVEQELPETVREAHNTNAMEMAKRGEWPVGGCVFVERDAAEGRAWEEHFARFGTRPRWMTLSKGVGAYMPAQRPPCSPIEA